jgi:hypothetical protein
MMEGCFGLCVEVFRKDVLDLLQLLKEKDIKIKVSQYDALEGYKHFDEQATLHFLCHNFSLCSQVIHNCMNEDNIYEIEFFRLECGKWCFSSKYKM